MKKLFFLVFPHILIVPLAIAIGLLFGFVDTLGGWVEALNDPSFGSGGGPAHIGGGPGLIVIGVILGILVASALWGLTMAGLEAALMGALYGVVAASLLEWLWFRLRHRDLPATDIRTIKRWSGRGALAGAVLTCVLACFNPIAEVIGVFAVTGTMLCLAGGTWGLIRWLWAKRCIKSGQAILGHGS
jgi:hypothetical protein